MCFLRFSTFWGQNSVLPQFGGGGAEGSKTQKLPFFNQSIENQKLYNVSKNQPLMSIRRGDIGFLPFLTSKKSCSSIISPSNIARKVKLDIHI